MTITTFDKLSPQDQSLVRLAMQYRDNAYTPYSHHQVGASVVQLPAPATVGVM